MMSMGMRLITQVHYNDAVDPDERHGVSLNVMPDIEGRGLTPEAAMLDLVARLGAYNARAAVMDRPKQATSQPAEVAP